MAIYEVRLPKMGESVMEATVSNWLVQPGDRVEVDDGIVEVSTDKVDTEIPSEVGGVLKEHRFAEGDVVKVGEILAIIETDQSAPAVGESVHDSSAEPGIQEGGAVPFVPSQEEVPGTIENKGNTNPYSGYYSPLVRSIARKEGLSPEELASIPGSGKGGRLTKEDVLGYLKERSGMKKNAAIPEMSGRSSAVSPSENEQTVIPLDKMGKIIAEHMIYSVQTSAHVQSFIEIDVTRIVQWRQRVKDDFLRKTGEKLTYTPIFMHAVAQVIREFPMVNIRFDGENITVLKSVHLGMAAALPDGNLIVPVIKNADDLSLTGMAKAVNRLAKAAREGTLKPDDISGGTYTVTNIGNFGSLTGTPIINQPQVAILALGAIRKVPAVIETPAGDSIGIRHQMIVAHSYDHRVINGALGGRFILRLKEILEQFDENTPF